jgi:hypothetical protein
LECGEAKTRKKNAMKKLLLILAVSAAFVSTALAKELMTPQGIPVSYEYRCGWIRTFPEQKSPSYGWNTEILLNRNRAESYPELYVVHTVGGKPVYRPEQYRTKTTKAEHEDSVSYQWNGVLKSNPAITMIGTLDMGEGLQPFYAEQFFKNGKLEWVSVFTCETK